MERIKANSNISPVDRLDHYTFYSPDGCWYWTASIRVAGYGGLWVNGKYLLAHRFSYETFKGTIPSGMFVCHTCDNRLCINPDHLWLGTNQDNMDDMNKKKRGITHSGEKNGKSIFVLSQVTEIRKLKLTKSLHELSKMFNCSKSAISHIIKNRVWRNV